MVPAAILLADELNTSARIKIFKHFPKPTFEKETVYQFLRDEHNLCGELSELGSYDDQNFLFREIAGNRYIVKISHAGTGIAELEAQNLVLQLLARKLPAGRFPVPVKNVLGREIGRRQSSSGQTFFARLLTFVKGVFLCDINAPPLMAFGRFLARMDRVLESFDHPGIHRDYLWDLKNIPALHTYLPYLANDEQRALVDYFLLKFEQDVEPCLPRLPAGVIHGDANDTNTLLLPYTDGEPRFGLIDFGDLILTSRIFEPGIAATYAALNTDDPVGEALKVIQGYHQVIPLTPLEARLVFPLIGCRLSMSVTLSAYSRTLNPDNPHLQITSESGWKALTILAGQDYAAMQARFCELCSN